MDGQEGSEIGVKEKRKTEGRKKRKRRENRAGERPWSVHVPQPPAFDQDCDDPNLRFTILPEVWDTYFIHLFLAPARCAVYHVRRVRTTCHAAPVACPNYADWIRTLASAVALPDQDNLRQSPEFPTKRRKSSVADHEPKRRRLSGQDNVSPHSQRRRPSPAQAPGPERPAERRSARQGGRDEDRKRGQRLFGGLLGTLSQSSTSAAQKRRADIEKRQQDKLKSQDSEYDGLKKRRRERRDMIRRREKPFYEREAVRLFLLLASEAALTHCIDADAAFKPAGHGTLPENTDRACLGTLSYADASIAEQSG